MTKNKMWAAICFVLTFGHVFDLLLALDAHKWLAPYKYLTDIYAQWDPAYVMQEFYIRIISLTSGLILLPMAFCLALSFLRNRPNYALMLAYACWDLATVVIWRWNAYLSPVPIVNDWWASGLTAPWVIFPAILGVMAYRKISKTLAGSW